MNFKEALIYMLDDEIIQNEHIVKYRHTADFESRRVKSGDNVYYITYEDHCDEDHCESWWYQTYKLKKNDYSLDLIEILTILDKEFEVVE